MAILMTDQQHPIAPSLELVQQWTDEIYGGPGVVAASDDICLAKLAAQWGADQELEATLAEVSFLNSRALADRVRAARRPKPPSLKEQGLETLEDAPGPDYPRAMTVLNAEQHALIRRALEALSE
jgi:hypothetical protein